jgi:D-alanyl-D-alanine-carboxypeptidase/D-alanyl-D-alanine-endopeptidase
MEKIRMFLFLFAAAIVLTASAANGQSAGASPVPSDDVIRQILVKRLGPASERVGIVVGVIEPAGRRVVAHGSSGGAEKRSVDGDTVFEIGSTTKVFTSLLLADMVQRGEVALSDPISKYLPAGVKMPERGGRVITLEDLSRHRSALPRLPSNLDAASNPLNPYASYSVKQMYDFLSSYQLPRDIGAEFEYSNFGAGLLGHVLSLAAAKDYETLIRTRICEPLGMRSTAITLSPDLKSRLATGHDGLFKPTSNWDLPTLAGAGALRSTASDMLAFLAAQLGYAQSNLSAAIDLTRAKRTPSNPGMEIGLGWLMRPKRGSEIVWHNGGTGGYRTFAGFDPKARVGVIVLTNVSTPAGVDDIGFHLLDSESPVLPPDSPLVRPPQEHKEITLDSGTLDSFVGKYQFIPNVFMTITRKENQLSAQLTGQGPAEIYPENKTDFFYKVVDAQILFKTDSQGRANALVLRQLGRDQLAKKVEGDTEPIQEWFGRRETQVDPKILDSYVGRYQLPIGGAVFTVTREGNQLFTQQTGQQKIEVFAESERVFFPKLFDARITFEATGAGPAAAVVLHQNGRDIRGTRIPD